MSDLRETLKSEFKDPDYRYAYAESSLNTRIAAQIKILREQRGKTQAELGRVCGTKQAGFSRFEDVNHPVWQTDTLWKIARALDVRVKISFETFGSLIEEEKDEFSREGLQRPDFEGDPAFKESPQEQVASPASATNLAINPDTVTPKDIEVIECKEKRTEPLTANPGTSFVSPKLGDILAGISAGGVLQQVISFGGIWKSIMPMPKIATPAIMSLLLDMPNYAKILENSSWRSLLEDTTRATQAITSVEHTMRMFSAATASLKATSLVEVSAWDVSATKIQELDPQHQTGLFLVPLKSTEVKPEDVQEDATKYSIERATSATLTILPRKYA